MPNTPAAIGQGMTVACASPEVTRDQALRCNTLLEAVGDVCPAVVRAHRRYRAAGLYGDDEAQEHAGDGGVDP